MSNSTLSTFSSTKLMLAIAIVPVLLAATEARAESLEDKKFWKGEMAYVEKSLKLGETKCGVKFSFEWVDKEKLHVETEKNRNSPSGVCNAIIDQVWQLCGNGEDEKAAVKAKIKGFKCGYAKPRKLELSGGIITLMGNFVEANFSDWARPWLMKNL